MTTLEFFTLPVRSWQKLANRLVGAVNMRTPIAGHGILITEGPNGYIISLATATTDSQATPSNAAGSSAGSGGSSTDGGSGQSGGGTQSGGSSTDGNADNVPDTIQRADGTVIDTTDIPPPVSNNSSGQPTGYIIYNMGTDSDGMILVHGGSSSHFAGPTAGYSDSTSAYWWVGDVTRWVEFHYLYGPNYDVGPAVSSSAPVAVAGGHSLSLPFHLNPIIA